MRTPIFQIDAFASRRFAGNPAAVMPMESFLPDAMLQSIAAENNLAETERLEPQRSRVVFHSASGQLTVHRAGGNYVMDFPARASDCVPAPPALAAALGLVPLEVCANAFNYLVLVDSAQALRALVPDMADIARLDRGGVIVTAPADQGYDFVSRYFAPAKGVPEDPVTGSAHCMLAPYWAKRLGKTQFRAFQASQRGGEIICRLVGDRVELEGCCVFYMEGAAEI